MPTDVESLRLRFKGLRNPHVKAVLLFGSRARGEVHEKSDVDLLILHDGCVAEDPVERRRALYMETVDLVGDLFEAITVLDMKLDGFLNPKEVTPLLLNIYWDAVVVYDKTGLLEPFLGALGLEYRRTG